VGGNAGAANDTPRGPPGCGNIGGGAVALGGGGFLAACILLNASCQEAGWAIPALLGMPPSLGMIWRGIRPVSGIAMASV
jgi:hypothetical protein